VLTESVQFSTADHQCLGLWAGKSQFRETCRMSTIEKRHNRGYPCLGVSISCQSTLTAWYADDRRLCPVPSASPFVFGSLAHSGGERLKEDGSIALNPRRTSDATLLGPYRRNQKAYKAIKVSHLLLIFQQSSISRNKPSSNNQLPTSQPSRNHRQRSQDALHQRPCSRYRFRRERCRPSLVR